MNKEKYLKCPQCLKLIPKNETDNCDNCDQQFCTECLTLITFKPN